MELARSSTGREVREADVTLRMIVREQLLGRAVPVEWKASP
jgi:hypothetical protein